jgi:hypothetical protein
LSSSSSRHFLRHRSRTEASAARRAKRNPCRCPRGRRAGDLVPMRGVASDARRATPAARPSGRVSGVRGDAYCLPKQQRSFGWRRIAAAAQIRPTQRRPAGRTRAPRQLLCRGAGVAPCDPPRRPGRASGARVRTRSRPGRRRECSYRRDPSLWPLVRRHVGPSRSSGEDVRRPRRRRSCPAAAARAPGGSPRAGWEPSALPARRRCACAADALARLRRGNAEADLLF